MKHRLVKSVRTKFHKYSAHRIMARRLICPHFWCRFNQNRALKKSELRTSSRKHSNGEYENSFIRVYDYPE